ncbi:glycosyltransferase [Mangrovimonas aestuarii]|uniref:glycosyltransferase n=1 Tax=Mangrovimonas aestuarii TaxID=3018443 RepID=UPI0023783A7C|nr:glycosyltransferase [Mangrovimonas aestuarii]
MRVLFWVTKFPAISETFIRDQIVALLGRGLLVTIYPQKGIVEEQMQALEGFEAYKLQDCIVDIDHYFEKRKILRLWKALGILIRIGFSSKRQYYLRALHPKFKAQAWSLRLFFRLHFLLEQGISVIHVHFGTNALDAILLKQLGLPLKFFVTYHGYDIRLGIEKGGHLYAPVFAHADGLIAISNYNKSHLLNFGAPLDKIINLPNGLDCNFFKRESPINGIEGKVKLLSVARLVEEKALHIAIEALAMVKAQCPQLEFEYTIIGEGECRIVLESLVKSLGLEDCVCFKGSQNSEVVRDAMVCHDIFLLSSDVEAMPTVLLEAQASGMMVVATNVGSVMDAVVSGVVVTKNDPEAFTKGILSVLEIRPEWGGVTEQGVVTISSDYSIDKISNELLKLYCL